MLLIIYRSLPIETTNSTQFNPLPWIPGEVLTEENLFDDWIGSIVDDMIVLPVTPVPVAEVPAAPVPVPAAPVKKRKKRKKKDKNATKKAKNGFLFFSMSSRQGIKVANPGYSFADVARHIGQLWRSMSIEDKAIFQEMAEKDKVRYQTEFAAYLLKKKNEALGQVVDIEVVKDTIEIWDGPTADEKWDKGAETAIDLTID